jgi:hypothetical protein
LRDEKINRAPSVTAPIYGLGWSPSLPEFSENLAFVSGVSLGDPVRLALPAGAAPTALVPLGQPPLPAGTPASALPIEWSLVKGDLPAAQGRTWRCLSRTDAGAGVELDKPGVSIIADGLGICLKAGQSFMVRSMTDAEMDEEVDARVLPLTVTDAGVRHMDFRGATRKLTETPWPNWPVLGPRTTKWATEYIVGQDGTARSRHTKWKHESGLNVTDPGVSDHELVMRVVTLALEYDQLNISELACFELLMRRAQMSEWKYRERILGRSGTVLEELDDEHLYMGVSEVRGLLMVSPLLSEHISAELHREAVSLKERRKLREERRSAQGKATGSGGGGGGEGNKG